MKAPLVSLSGGRLSGPLYGPRFSCVASQVYSRGAQAKRTELNRKQTISGHYRPQSGAFASSPIHSRDYATDTSQTPSKDGMSCVSLILTPDVLLSVREFWFEHLSGPDSLVMPSAEENKRWFFGGAEFDRLCVERFAPTLEAIRRQGIKSGQDIIYALQPTDAHDWLSLILLLDQMTRNCYRGDSADAVFRDFDPMARDVALTALQRGIPERRPEIRWRFACRSWFYVPLIHSEDRELHHLAVEKYQAFAHDVESLLLPETSGMSHGDESEEAREYRIAAQRVAQASPEAAREYAHLNLGFEKRHWAVIERFGRYPHRNRAMGRETTDEERQYLENGGDAFGG
ncbi:hypothetical protein V8C37DRAFT_380373 [Trichoderma ceciliae]